LGDGVCVVEDCVVCHVCSYANVTVSDTPAAVMVLIL